eukprot:TRINITY_DN9928_c0_g2_i1.p1 TRINITY_DN9928_c0_g2~~TRINITY_DN9928_c0_g2_i1.p1  ORF type:complete len:1236 (+),score=152.78 TRINITY_DN9928_c0_g2_i1:80-3787(+)
MRGAGWRVRPLLLALLAVPRAPAVRCWLFVGTPGMCQNAASETLSAMKDVGIPCTQCEGLAENCSDAIAYACENSTRECRLVGSGGPPQCPLTGTGWNRHDAAGGPASGPASQGDGSADWTCYFASYCPTGGPQSAPTGAPAGPTLAPSASPNCWEQDVDYAGHDCDNAQDMTDPASCQQLCRTRPCCTHWTWSNSKAKCYTKVSNAGSSTRADYVSGQRYCSPPSAPPTPLPSLPPTPLPSAGPTSSPTSGPSGFCWEYDIDFRDGDCAGPVAGIPNPSACWHECQKVPCCLYWTWQIHISTCYLKDNNSGREANSGRVSGPRGQCTQPPTPAPSAGCWEADIDFPGGDIYSGSAPAGCALECQHYCDTEPSCQCWSFFGRDYKCWVKKDLIQRDRKIQRLFYVSGYRNSRNCGISADSCPPTASPSAAPSRAPTAAPVFPTAGPSLRPSLGPSVPPSRAPSTVPPSTSPTRLPSVSPSQHPSRLPSRQPSVSPTLSPSQPPSRLPSRQPSASPPTAAPVDPPTRAPSVPPSPQPSTRPSLPPSASPSARPTRWPSAVPSRRPTAAPLLPPTGSPSLPPTVPPSVPPSVPSASPRPPSLPPVSPSPSPVPSTAPSSQTPSAAPHSQPPSTAPRSPPPSPPSQPPSSSPSPLPSQPPTVAPTRVPLTRPPSAPPSASPLPSPSASPLPPTASPRPPGVAAADPSLTGSTVYASFALGSMLDAPPGMGGMALTAGTGCPNAETELSFILHPLRFRVADNVFAGAVVGNSGIVVGLALLAFLLRGAVGAVGRRMGRTPEQTAALFKFPGSLFKPCTVLYQGAVYASGRLLLDWGNLDAVTVPVGAAGFLTVALGVPAALQVVVVRHMGGAHYALDPETTAVFKVWLIGPGEWVNNTTALWYSRYGSVLKPYKPPRAGHALLAQCAETLLLGLFAALHKAGDSACAVNYMAVALVFSTHAAWTYWVKAYARPRDMCFELVTTVLQIAAVTCKAVGHLGGGDGWEDVALALLRGALIAVVAKVLTDLFTEIYLFRCKRRMRLQREHLTAWMEEEEESGSSKLLVEMLPVPADHNAHCGEFAAPTSPTGSDVHARTLGAPPVGSPLSCTKTSFDWRDPRTRGPPPSASSDAAGRRPSTADRRRVPRLRNCNSPSGTFRQLDTGRGDSLRNTMSGVSGLLLGGTTPSCGSARRDSAGSPPRRAQRQASSPVNRSRGRKRRGAREVPLASGAMGTVTEPVYV